MNKYLAYKCMHEEKVVKASADGITLFVIIKRITESQYGWENATIRCDVLEPKDYAAGFIYRYPNELSTCEIFL